MLLPLKQQQIPSQIITLLASHNGPKEPSTISDKDEASWMMELLQTELDRVRALRDAQHRAMCLKLMRQLNRLHGVLPPSMFLKDLMCESKHPVTGGGFADIWIGRLNEQRVCVKVLRFFLQGSDRETLQQALGKEVLLWRQLNHPNILPFLGINTELFPPTFCIVSPWMSNGDIISYSRKSPLDLNTKLKHMIQIAEGLEYLHGLDPPVVHGDLKGANILISDDHRCCLADFGLSILDTQSVNPTHTSTVQGSLRWLAPEFISPAPQSPQTSLTPRDIYAFGCTVFELLTEKPPFSHHNQDISVAIDVLKGVRPVLPADIVPNEAIFKTIQVVLSWCWSEQSKLRPKAQDVLEFLKDVYSILLSGPEASLNLFSLLPTLGGKSAASIPRQYLETLNINTEQTKPRVEETPAAETAASSTPKTTSYLPSSSKPQEHPKGKAPIRTFSKERPKSKPKFGPRVPNLKPLPETPKPGGSSSKPLSKTPLRAWNKVRPFFKRPDEQLVRSLSVTPKKPVDSKDDTVERRGVSMSSTHARGLIQYEETGPPTPLRQSPPPSSILPRGALELRGKEDDSNAPSIQWRRSGSGSGSEGEDVFYDAQATLSDNSSVELCSIDSSSSPSAAMNPTVAAPISGDLHATTVSRPHLAMLYSGIGVPSSSTGTVGSSSDGDDPRFRVSRIASHLEDEPTRQMPPPDVPNAPNGLSRYSGSVGDSDEDDEFQGLTTPPPPYGIRKWRFHVQSHESSDSEKDYDGVSAGPSESYSSRTSRSSTYSRDEPIRQTPPHDVPNARIGLSRYLRSAGISDTGSEGLTASDGPSPPVSSRSVVTSAYRPPPAPISLSSVHENSEKDVDRFAYLPPSRLVASSNALESSEEDKEDWDEVVSPSSRSAESFASDSEGQMESLDDWSESLAIQLLDDDRDSGMQDKSWGGRGPITTARKFSSSSEGQELAGTSNERPTISAPTFRSASEENENLYRQYLARMDLKRSASSTYGLLSASAVSQDSEKQNWGSAEGEKSANYRRILPNGRTWQSAAMPRSENDRERLIESAEEPSPVVKSLPFPGIVELSVDEVYGSVSTRVSSEGGLQWDNPVLRDALDGYRRRQAILSI